MHGDCANKEDNDPHVQDKKDPLDFDAAKLANNIKEWSINSSNSKQRDKE